uniref:Assembly factor for spindle microtubules n=1 Tax=Latimeria chalumnae TaxID=7897 RepID=H2ZSM4_LATCH
TCNFRRGEVEDDLRKKSRLEMEAGEYPVLTLSHFSRTPFVSFGTIRIGGSKTAFLEIENPHPDPIEVVIDKFPTAKGFSTEPRCFFLQPMERTRLSIAWTPAEEGGVRELIIFVVNGVVKHQAILLGKAERAPKKKRSLWENIKRKKGSEELISLKTKKNEVAKKKVVNQTFHVLQKLEGTSNKPVRSPLQSCENVSIIEGESPGEQKTKCQIHETLTISPICPVQTELQGQTCIPHSLRGSLTYSVLYTAEHGIPLQEDTARLNSQTAVDLDQEERTSSVSSQNFQSELINVQCASAKTDIELLNHACPPAYTPDCLIVQQTPCRQRRILTPDSFVNDSYVPDEDPELPVSTEILSPDQFLKEALAAVHSYPLQESLKLSSPKSSSLQSSTPNDSYILNDKENDGLGFPVKVEDLEPVKNRLTYFIQNKEHTILKKTSRSVKPPVVTTTVIKSRPHFEENRAEPKKKPKSRRRLGHPVGETEDTAVNNNGAVGKSKGINFQGLPVIGSTMNCGTQSNIPVTFNLPHVKLTSQRKRKSGEYLDDIKLSREENMECSKRCRMHIFEEKKSTNEKRSISRQIGGGKQALRKKAEVILYKLPILKTGKTPKPVVRVAQSCLTFKKTVKTVIPRHPMPFAAKNMFFDERWKEKQERGFTWWLNYILTPDDLTVNVEFSKVNAAALILGTDSQHKISVPKAPTKEEMSLRAYTAKCRLNRLRRTACRFFTSDSMVRAIQRLEIEIEAKRLLVRMDRHLWKDIGERRKVLNWLLSYNPLWLRIGLETVFGELISLESNSDVMGLAMFILNRLLWNPDIAAEYRHPRVPHLYRDGHEEALSRFTLKKLLLLVCFLDRAKQSRLIDHDPCLFCRDAEFKASKDLLLAFSRDFLSGEGDLSRHLSYLGLAVSHVQTPLDEFDFAVTNLAVDLRYGIRLVRMVELLTQKWSLSKQLRVPAISRLQKMHNVEVAFGVLRERGIQMKDEYGTTIDPRDIIDGHRERTLALLWRIAFSFQVEILLSEEQLLEEIKFLKHNWLNQQKLATLKTTALSAKEKEQNEAAADGCSTKVQLLMDWVNAVSAYYDTKVENFTVSFSDGQVLCYLIHHYHPCYLPKEAIYQRTTHTVEFAQNGAVAINSSASESDDSAQDLCPEAFHSTETSVLYKELLENEKKNFQLVNSAVAELGGVPAMIYHSDMSNTIPDQKVVITYLSFLCARLLDLCKEARAARLIQAVWRKYKLKRKLRLQQKKDKAACVIQQAVGRFLERRHLKQRVSAAVSIQAAWRGYTAKRRVRELKMEVALKAQFAAVIVIQAWWRRYSARKNFQKLWYYVVLVQSKMRRKIAVTSYKRQLWAAVTIQKHLRATLLTKKDHQRYIILKTSALVIQSAFRRWKTRKLEKQIKAVVCLQSAFRKWQAHKLAKTTKAAISIQSWYRLCRTRNQYLHIQQSVVRIQTWFRCYKARCDFKAKKVAILTIQKHYRVFRQGKDERQRYVQRRKAAVTIQAYYRGMKIRQFARQMKAACTIQSYWRMKRQRLQFVHKKDSIILLQSQVRKWLTLRSYQTKKKAACVIQAHYRACVASKKLSLEYKRKRSAIILLQSAYRRLQARREAQKLRSVLKIQACFRAHLTQKKFKKMKGAAIKIQAWVKMVRARADYQALKKATLCVQRWYCAKKCTLKQMEEYKRQKEICIHLQALIRGYLIRRQVHLWRKAAVAIQSAYRMHRERTCYLNKCNAATVIQRYYRAYKEKVSERSGFLKVKTATVCLQAAYRGYVVRKTLKYQHWAATVIQATFRAHATHTKYLAMQKACVMIQRWYRAGKMRRQERDNYRKLKTAAVTLQAVYRGLVARKVLKRQQEAAVQIQAVFRMFRAKKRFRQVKSAMLTIQQHFKVKLAGARQRQEFLALRRSALRIQAVWKGRKARKELQRQHCAAAIIQSYYRMKRERRKFLESRLAALVIQQHYRAFIVARKQHCHYLKVQKAVLILQASFRGMKTRRKLQKLHNSAITIQSAFRAYMLKKRYRLLRSVAVTLQRKYRAIVLARQQQREYNRIQSAVVKIQAVYRGMKVRREIQQMHQAAVAIQAAFRMHRLQLRYLAMKLATIVIQTRYRAYMKRKVEREKYLLLCQCTIFIQSTYRGLKVRKRIKIMHKAATVIQSLYRMHKQQKTFKRLRWAAEVVQQRYRAGKQRNIELQRYSRLKKAAVYLQSAFRGMKVRRQLKKRHIAATVIQSKFRAYLQRKRYLSLKKAAITVQCMYKAKREHQEFLSVRTAAITLQSAYRGMQVRKRIKQMHHAAIVIQTAFRMHKFRISYLAMKLATVLLQQHYRAYVKGKLEREKYLKQRNSATVIKAVYKGMKVRQQLKKMHSAATVIQRRFKTHMERNRYLSIRTAAISIQNLYRSVIFARQQRQKYLRLRRAATVIQAAYRGFQIRRQIQQIQITVTIIQRAYRMHRVRKTYLTMKLAAVTIQNHYRAYIQGKVQREKYLKLCTSVVVIQSAFRGMRLRQQVAIRHRAATVIQSQYRMYKQYMSYKRICWASKVVQQRYRAKKKGAAEVQQYNKIKAAAVCLQSAFRAKKARQLVRSHRAAKCIQSFLQMCVERKCYLRQKAAVLVLQAAYRGYKVRACCRTMKLSAVVIQRWCRAWKLTWKQKEEYQATKQAAVVIQSAFKGMIARRLLQQKRAAIKVQYFLCMVMYRRRFLRLKSAAITIQTHYRAYRAKTLYQTYRKAAVLLQTHYRAYIAMKQQRTNFFRIQKSIITFQAGVSGFIARRQLQKLEKSTIAIQAAFRGFRVRLLAKQERAACKIQSWFRGYRLRQQYKSTLKAVAVIRGFVQTRLQRARYLEMRAATVLIQKKWRETLIARSTRQEFLQLRAQKAAHLIQTWYRGYKKRQQFLQQRTAALTLQKYVRAWQQGRTEKMKYERIRTAFIMLQALWRGWIVRKKVSEQKQLERRVRFIAAAYHHLCALRIQRMWRIHLALKHARNRINSVICIQ